MSHFEFVPRENSRPEVIGDEPPPVQPRLHDASMRHTDCDDDEYLDFD
jgi:hypothetical protein